MPNDLIQTFSKFYKQTKKYKNNIKGMNHCMVTRTFLQNKKKRKRRQLVGFIFFIFGNKLEFRSVQIPKYIQIPEISTNTYLINKINKINKNCPLLYYIFSDEY